MFKHGVLYFALLVVVRASEDMSSLGTIAVYSNAKQCSDVPEVGIYKICWNFTLSNICVDRTLMHMDTCSDPIPFCDQGSCTSTPNIKFRCPQPYGHFPSLTTCDEYVICTNGKSETVYCGEMMVYDARTKSCVPQSEQFPCNKFNCTNKNDEFTTYPGDRMINALCLNGVPIRVAEILMKSVRP